MSVDPEPSRATLERAHLPDHRRLTARELEALSVEALQALLRSPQHYAATTRNYGDRDPLVEPGRLVWRCDADCPASLRYDTLDEELLSLARGTAIRQGTAANFVKCDQCQRVGPPSLREWRAVVDWNYLRAKEGLGDVAHFPFFLLDGLTREEQIAKLESIRYDLTVRRTLERKRKEAGAEVGKRFMAKIEAYLGWASVALALLQPTAPSRKRSAQPRPPTETP